MGTTYRCGSASCIADILGGASDSYGDGVTPWFLARLSQTHTVCIWYTVCLKSDLDIKDAVSEVEQVLVERILNYQIVLPGTTPKVIDCHHLKVL